MAQFNYTERDGYFIVLTELENTKYAMLVDKESSKMFYIENILMPDAAIFANSTINDAIDEVEEFFKGEGYKLQNCA